MARKYKKDTRRYTSRAKAMNTARFFRDVMGRQSVKVAKTPGKKEYFVKFK
jgi:hypothetical protein